MDRMMSRFLAAESVRRAAYIDFEGRAGRDPVLLGILIDDDGNTEFRQFLLDESYWCLEGIKAGTVRGTLKDALSRIPLSIPVYAWSSHESKVINTLLTGEDRLRWEDRITNAIPIARHWSRTLPPDVQPVKIERRGTHTLDQYLSIVGYKVSTSHGPGKTGSRVSTFDSLLQRSRPYERWTAVQKSHWTKFLAHNRHDCFGLRRVLRHIANIPVD